MKKIRSITIITSPFCCIPPDAIGAVEKIWKSSGDYFKSKGIEVNYVCKRPKTESKEKNIYYVNGYKRTGSWLKDFLLDFVYSFKALRIAPKTDAIVLNTIWSPILMWLFKNKYQVSLYNVQRVPKHQFILYKSVDILSCVSSSVYDILLHQTPSAKKQASVVNNFIDTSVFHPYKKHILSDNPVIVYSGRVHREKGLDLLVRAINIVRQSRTVTLKIIGAWNTESGGSGEEYKNELNTLAEGWKIEWVPPIYSPEELAREIDLGDIYCYPSMADNGETFGVAPLEAMGLGLPVIVSALDCFKDFVEDGKNGMVFDHHAKDASKLLAQCILTILNEGKKYRMFSENSAITAKCFGINQKSEEYLLLMENMMNYRKTGFNEKIKKVVSLPS